SMIETYFDSTDHENKIRMVDEFIVKKGYDKNQLGDGKDLNHEAWKQPGRLKNLFNHLIALPDLGEGIPPY
ncbi:MAG: hypothetical protein GY856_35165, partial [bacterium]|nr:hypothetical protein [bacterium]